MIDRTERYVQLSNNRDSSIRVADALVVSISSAVLALSINFLSQTDNYVYTWALKVAWVEFAITILSVFISLLIERSEWKRLMSLVANNAPETSGFATIAIRGLNTIAYLLFIQAFIFIVIFLFANTI